MPLSFLMSVYGWWSWVKFSECKDTESAAGCSFALLLDQLIQAAVLESHFFWNG